MTFKISKGKQIKKGVKQFEIQILDENKNIIEQLSHVGHHVGAKKKAQERVKEIIQTEKELNSFPLAA